jgi:hypothetical protein
MKLTESELRKKLGTRDSLPGGDKQLSPQMKPKTPTKTPSPGLDPQISVDPKRVMCGREEKAEMAKGGKVKGNPFGKPASKTAKPKQMAFPFKGAKK